MPNAECITLEDVVESMHTLATKSRDDDQNSHRASQKCFTKNKMLIFLLIATVVLACVIVYLLVVTKGN